MKRSVRKRREILHFSSQLLGRNRVPQMPLCRVVARLRPPSTSSVWVTLTLTLSHRGHARAPLGFQQPWTAHAPTAADNNRKQHTHPRTVPAYLLYSSAL